MIIYPNKAETFTIDDFRIDNSEKCAYYYIHVVNDETHVCLRQFYTWNFALMMKEYKKLKEEVADGWHIEVTVSISNTSEQRARLM